MTIEASVEQKSCFQLKGGLFTLTSIVLLNPTLEGLSEQLNYKVKQAPRFFCNAPIVIDLQKINEEDVLVDFRELSRILRDVKLIPVGVRGGNAQQNQMASMVGFAILPETEIRSKDIEIKDRESESKPSSTQQATSSEIINTTPTKLITQPVRSGQQVYARGGDLVILAAVSQGAEILADGHIHVYGPLRGRALAGISGDRNAHIFCASLEAELISVAGQYRVSEDFKTSMWKKQVKIHLSGDHLIVNDLNNNR